MEDLTMRDSYGSIFADMVDRAARFMDRPDIFRLLGISRNHFYNVTNPDRQTSSGHDYPFPTEWGVKGTNQFHDYEWVKAVCNDCGCICITPEELKELKDSNPRKAINVFQKIIGLVSREKKGKAE
jgi:predicted DNA-binding transcriptional regulator AlpA